MDGGRTAGEGTGKGGAEGKHMRVVKTASTTKMKNQGRRHSLGSGRLGVADLGFQDRNRIGSEAGGARRCRG